MPWDEFRVKSSDLHIVKCNAWILLVQDLYKMFENYVSSRLCCEHYLYVTVLWHSGQKLYLLIWCSWAQCLHTLHIQDWYSWIGWPVAMHMGNFPSVLKEREKKKAIRQLLSTEMFKRGQDVKNSYSLVPVNGDGVFTVFLWLLWNVTHPSGNWSVSRARLSSGVCLVKISRARSS